MRLSKNFTLEEMVATSHRKLQDTPTLAVVQNLQRLCVLVLQPLRDAIGRPVYINSGYRSKRLIFDLLKQNPNVDKAIIERKGHATWVHVQM